MLHTAAATVAEMHKIIHVAAGTLAHMHTHQGVVCGVVTPASTMQAETATQEEGEVSTCW